MFKNQRVNSLSEHDVPARIDFFQKIGIGAIVIAQFGLLMPFNVGSSFIARSLTTDKLYWYLAFFVLIWLLNAKNKVTINIPGFSIFCTILLCMGLSTVIGGTNTGNDSWFLFAKQIGYLLFCIAAILILGSMAALKCYLRWCFYITVFFVLINAFSLVNLSDVLPSTLKATHLQSMIESQRRSVGPGGRHDIIRGGALWFDSNNFAYIIGAQILFVVYWLVNATRRHVSILLCCILILFCYSMVLTFSRGGLFGTMLGLAVFLFFMVRKGVVRARKVIKVVVILLVPIMLIILLSGSTAVSILGKRIWFATGLLGTSASSEMTGLETSRLVTATIAFGEFLEQPIMGRGIGFHPGTINRGRVQQTGNHLSYLNILAKYGVMGFLLQFVLLWIVFSRLVRSIRYLEKSDDENYKLGYFILAVISFMLVSGLFRSINIYHLSIIPLAFYLSCYKEYRTRVRRGQIICARRIGLSKFGNTTV